MQSSSESSQRTFILCLSDQLSQPKISKDEFLFLFAEEDVLRFDVSMHDVE